MPGRPSELSRTCSIQHVALDMTDSAAPDFTRNAIEEGPSRTPSLALKSRLPRIIPKSYSIDPQTRINFFPSSTGRQSFVNRLAVLSQICILACASVAFASSHPNYTPRPYHAKVHQKAPHGSHFQKATKHPKPKTHNRH